MTFDFETQENNSSAEKPTYVGEITLRIYTQAFASRKPSKLLRVIGLGSQEGC